MKNKNQRELNKEQIHVLMDLPFEYFKARAHEEKVKWDLELSFIVDGYEKGGRKIFGLNLNDLCFPIYDLQEPKHGFLNNFISWYMLTNDNKSNNNNLNQ
jgi:hypothetical protein